MRPFPLFALLLAPSLLAGCVAPGPGYGPGYGRPAYGYGYGGGYRAPSYGSYGYGRAPSFVQQPRFDRGGDGYRDPSRGRYGEGRAPSFVEQPRPDRGGGGGGRGQREARPQDSGRGAFRDGGDGRIQAPHPNASSTQ